MGSVTSTAARLSTFAWTAVLACSVAWANETQVADHGSHPAHAPHGMNHGHGHHPGSTQTSDYVGLKERPLKALSTQQVEDLRAGRGMGWSLAAELNSVPGPRHVLQLQQQLGVSAEQASLLQDIVQAMEARARALGEEIIVAETQLDSGFRNKSLSQEQVLDLSSRIGALNGQLRAAHLQAHLQTAALLSPKQIAAYDLARGYTPAAR